MSSQSVIEVMEEEYTRETNLQHEECDGDVTMRQILKKNEVEGNLSFRGLAFYHVQDLLLYQRFCPLGSRGKMVLPCEFCLPFEPVFVKTDDGVNLCMCHVKEHADDSPTIMILHGNAGNMGHMLPMTQELMDRIECNVLLVEYRGYGISSGYPSEEGLYLDAMAALKWLKTKSSKIFVLGICLGGAVAIRVSSDPRYAGTIKGIMLQNTFTSIPEVVSSFCCLGWMSYLPMCCFKNKFPSVNRIGNVKMPTLFLSSRKDEMFPCKMMDVLSKLVGSTEKTIIYLPDSTHNDAHLCLEYYIFISTFVSKVLNDGINVKEDKCQVTIENS